MKTMKKLASMALALVMLMALMVPAMAVEPADASITVSNAYANQTYTIYKLFDATVTDTRVDGGTGIAYTLMANKTDFKAGDLDGAIWFDFIRDDEGNKVSDNIVATKTSITSNPDAFRAWAEAYGAEGKSITPTVDGAIIFDDLTYGYYYITTTTGSLVTVDSVKPNETVIDKNTLPEIAKVISAVKDGIDNSGMILDSGASAIAQIGDTITYTLTVKAYEGAENYTVIDDLGDGLTLNEGSVVIKVGEATLTAGEDKDYTVTYAETDPELTINFTKKYLDTVKGTTTTPTEITITYTAVLNDSAVIGAVGNPNEVYLKYGHDNDNLSETAKVSAKVYTGSLTVTKTDGADATAIMNGVKFTLQNAAGKYYSYVNGDVVWSDTKVELVVGTDITAVDNQIYVKGLANGTYTLTETETLPGYNLLTTPLEIVISTQVTKDEEGNDIAVLSDGNLIQSREVENNKGAELPDTGGIGTTIFTVAGGVLMVGAAVLFITKKRSTNG